MRSRRGKQSHRSENALVRFLLEVEIEVEHYLIKAIVDGIREHVPENELPLLDAMLIEYERKVVKNVKTSKA